MNNKSDEDPDFPGIVPWDDEGLGGIQTMCSTEIAKLCNKRHDNVMRDIQATLAQCGIDALKFEGVYLDAHNQLRPCYFLPKTECILIITGYSAPYRLAILRRWEELEKKVLDIKKPEIPQTLAAALRLAADQIDKNDALERELYQQEKLLEEQKPAVEFVSKYVEVANLFSISDTAKLLGYQQNQFIKLLLHHKILFRRGASGKLRPYSEWLNKGYLDIETHLVNDERAYDQTKFTTLGRTWIEQYLAKKTAV